MRRFSKSEMSRTAGTAVPIFACSTSMREFTQLAYILSFSRKMQLQFFFCKNCFKADRSPAGMGVSRTICPCSSQSWPFI